MKKLLLLLLVFAGFLACENEMILELPQEVSKTEGISAKKGQKIDVCHKGKIINVSVNSLSGHQGHGDAVDMDGDGYFDIENDCSEVDCDDMNPDQYPGAEEEQWWYFIGEDNDLDGWITFDQIFGDCRPSGYLNFDDTIASLELLGFPGLGDCDDENSNVNPGAPEICDDVDNNCDGYLFDRSASATFNGISIAAGFARFGAAGTVSGEWVYADAFCIPTTALYIGKILLIDRGDCFFEQKVLNAEAAGAIGVIICNYDGSELVTMAPPIPPLGATIPSIIIQYEDCEIIKGSDVTTISFTVEDTCVESGGRMSNPESKNIISRRTLDRATGSVLSLDSTK